MIMIRTAINKLLRNWFLSKVSCRMNKSKNKAPENYPDYQDGIFKYRDDGFTVTFSDKFLSISWSEIKYIYAYKVDLLTTDCIVIEIHLNEKTF